MELQKIAAHQSAAYRTAALALQLSADLIKSEAPYAASELEGAAAANLRLAERAEVIAYAR